MPGLVRWFGLIIIDEKDRLHDDRTNGGVNELAWCLACLQCNNERKKS